MKSVIFLLAICSSFVSFGQQQAFKSVSLQQVNDREMIVFSTPNEVNVRHYRIEASNDMSDFQVIATIPSKANSMLPVQHSYDIAAQDYTYYRVAKVSMDNTMPYSEVLTRKQPATDKTNENILPPTMTSEAISASN